MVAMTACLLPVFLFLLFPELTCIQAFNRDGMDWTKTRESKCGEISEVGIALEADGTVCAIYCLTRDQQEALRARMLAVDPSVQFSGACEDLRNTNAARAQSNASRQGKDDKVIAPQFDELPNGKWRCNEPCHPIVADTAIGCALPLFCAGCRRQQELDDSRREAAAAAAAAQTLTAATNGNTGFYPFVAPDQGDMSDADYIKVCHRKYFLSPPKRGKHNPP